MTRETKSGMLVGLAFIIVIGILLSAHMTSTTETPRADQPRAGSDVRGRPTTGAPGAAPGRGGRRRRGRATPPRPGQSDHADGDPPAVDRDLAHANAAGVAGRAPAGVAAAGGACGSEHPGRPGRESRAADQHSD